jgi:hypothetical protein
MDGLNVVGTEAKCAGVECAFFLRETRFKGAASSEMMGVPAASNYSLGGDDSLFLQESSTVAKWLETGHAKPPPSAEHVMSGYSETKVLEDVHSVCAAPRISIHELYKL